MRVYESPDESDDNSNNPSSNILAVHLMRNARVRNLCDQAMHHNSSLLDETEFNRVTLFEGLCFMMCSNESVKKES